MELIVNDAVLQFKKLDIEDLVPLQGKLKTLDDKNFNKLRKQILDTGFAFTVHVWENDGKTFIIDGHQRISVLLQLKKQGYEIPKISCAFVEAKDFKEAKHRVFQAISQYGKLDEQGFFDFIGDEDFFIEENFDFPDLKFSLEDKDEILDLKDVNFNQEYLVIIECEGETDQSEIYDELKQRGFKCKIMT